MGTTGVVPQVQLNVSHTKLADLHPADIADILEQLDVEEAGAVLGGLDTETAADILNEVETPPVRAFERTRPGTRFRPAGTTRPG